MTVNGTETAVELPTVVLDATLADFYSRAGPSFEGKHIGQVLSGFSALIPLGPGMPRNRKYIYQDGPFASGNGDGTEANGNSSGSTAVKYLSLITQRDAFISGKESTCIFFDMDASTERQKHDRAQVIKTLATLSEDQRPKLIFCKGPAHIPVKDAGIDLVACKIVLDELEQYNNIVPLETHWFLNSKRALAESGLPTPKCVIITIKGCPAEAKACCELCGGLEPDDFVIPLACVGARGTWLKEQSIKLYETLMSHPLPFVLKNQETFGGAGTYFVRTEDERQEIIETLGKGLLNRLLSIINPLNSHLEPATLLFSELVQDPVGDYGITFFVNEKGIEPTFLGVSKQMIQGGTAWIGSTIDYSNQEELRVKFQSLIHQVAIWLQSHGYIGPAGADILETADGKYNVVDLNVRTTGSVALPLLRKHFTSRGFHCASSFSINVDKRREEFIKMFKQEIREGRLSILSWYEDMDSGSSLADVAAGGEDEDGLMEMMTRVREVSSNVTF